MNLIKFKATKNDEGRSLYKYLIKQLNNVPISKIEQLFRKKDIKVNEKRTSNKTYSIGENDEIIIYGIDNYKSEKKYLTKINFKVIYEDENILIINKPYNLSMHGFDDCLDNQVLTYLNFEQKDSFKPASIGRLDKTTSGLVVYAKKYKALVQLNNNINKFEKFYILKSDFQWYFKKVTFYGRKNKKNFNMDLFDTKPGIKMETIFIKDKNKRYAKILTGKKHQIRLTLKKLGFPIYGDRKYGGKIDKRVYLHSYKIIFHNLSDELKYLNDNQFICEIKW